MTEYSIFDDFGYDPKVADEGKWFDINKDVRFKICSTQSKAFQSALTSSLLMSEIQSDDPEFANNLQECMEVNAYLLVKDWENVREHTRDDDGKIIKTEDWPYSVDKVKEAFDRMPMVTRAVLGIAGKVSNFRDDGVDVEEKQKQLDEDIKK